MMNTKILDWVKKFKYSWLPDHINNDTQLIEIISNKLNELEQLIENNSQYQSDSPIVLNSLDDHHQTNENDNELLFRPAIRIKRISLAEAKRFLPPGWKTPKPKLRRKKGRKKLTLSPSTRKRNRNISSKAPQTTKVDSNGTRKSTRSNKLLAPSSSDSSSINEIKSKQKRKLRAMDHEDDDLITLGNLSQTENILDDCEQISRYIGQNGILSQTRKTNETTINTTTTTTTTTTTAFDDTHDTTFKIFSTTTPTTNEELPISDDQIDLSSNENHNSILNYDACIEDITNDGIDPPLPASSSSSNQFEQQLPLTT